MCIIIPCLLQRSDFTKEIGKWKINLKIKYLSLTKSLHLVNMLPFLIFGGLTDTAIFENAVLSSNSDFGEQWFWKTELSVIFETQYVGWSTLYVKFTHYSLNTTINI